jgi:hypothetical protein
VIQEKTTLILGAGASCHYGFPTGEELITRVCIKCEAFKGGPQGPESFFQKFSNILNGEQDNEELSFMHHERQSFRERTAKQAEALKEKLDIFSHKIRSLNPLNIDTFLRDQPQLQKIGAFLIAKVLLEAENYCRETPKRDHDQARITDNKKKEFDNWYRFLIHVLAACENSEELKKVFLDEQKLSIITFNYDVSLEYHLYHSLKNIEVFEHCAADFMRQFSENCIFHVYGAMHKIDWDAKNPFADFGASVKTEDDSLNEIRLAIKCSENIRTIYGRKSDPSDPSDPKDLEWEEKKKKFIEAIDQAGRLVILGYGFDDANTKHLSDLSDGKNNGLISALKTKRLYMTNYNDSKRIENKLNLKEREDYHFISDKNVYNALMYDFDLVS